MFKDEEKAASMRILVSVFDLVSAMRAASGVDEQGQIYIKLVIEIIDKRHYRVVIYERADIFDESGHAATISVRDSDCPQVEVEMKRKSAQTNIFFISVHTVSRIHQKSLRPTARHRV